MIESLTAKQRGSNRPLVKGKTVTTDDGPLIVNKGEEKVEGHGRGQEAGECIDLGEKSQDVGEEGVSGKIPARQRVVLQARLRTED